VGDFALHEGDRGIFLSNLLELSYERNWSPEHGLLLSLRRATEAPFSLSPGAVEAEGRLEYHRTF
jgi:hypothetical protein